jgi:hypothetical protein
MLKRSGILLLLLLYLITGIGFAVNLHYCGKLITSVEIGASLKSCNETGMMRGMKCCKNKRIDIKLKDAHQGQSQSFLGKLFSFKLVAVNHLPVQLLPQTFLYSHSCYLGPPGKLICATPVFIKNCTFRI